LCATRAIWTSEPVAIRITCSSPSLSARVFAATDGALGGRVPVLAAVQDGQVLPGQD
jgi:hypothetical protein